MSAKKKERRRFPRKEARVKVKLGAVGDRGAAFEAFLPSWDISIGGVFLESEFFMKAGTRLEVEFELPEGQEPVRARGVVVREERVVRRGRGVRSGFAIQFTEYLDDAWLSLATFFLAPEVGRFVAGYRRSGRPGRVRGEEAKMVDLIVAWEMARFEEGGGRFKP